MFTGIIEEVGVVGAIRTTPPGRRITVRSSSVAGRTGPGDSLAVNGVCVTAVERVPAGPPSGRPGIMADILTSTWKMTTFSDLRPGDRVNLERPLRAGERIGGHFVLGHVDGTGMIRSIRSEDGDVVMGISIGPDTEGGLVPRGSVAVDGVSLTVARLARGVFYVHLVPYTLSHTTLGDRRVGERVNIEMDILGKYVRDRRGGEITEEFLREKGFITSRSGEKSL